MSKRSGSRSSYSDHEVISGYDAVRQRSATTRPAVARGAAGHLWKLPVQKSAPSPVGASMSAGACAPSTMTGTSRSCASSTSRAIGRIAPVAALTWSTSRAEAPTRAGSIRATTVSSSACIGRSTTYSSAPRARATRSAAYREAPYTWLVVTIRVPVEIGTVAKAAVMPALAFATRAKPAGSASRKAASSSRAAVKRSGTERNQRIGFASASARSALRTSWVRRGTAPHEPWFRCTTAGSRLHRSGRGLSTVTTRTVHNS